MHIANSAGEDTLTCAPTRNDQALAFSSPELVQGETYTIDAEGSATGTPTDGWYQDATYSGGAEYASVTLSGVVTNVDTPALFGR